MEPAGSEYSVRDSSAWDKAGYGDPARGTELALEGRDLDGPGQCPIPFGESHARLALRRARKRAAAPGPTMSLHRETSPMKKHEDFQEHRQREDAAKQHPGKAPGHEKLPPPVASPRPHEAAPPEVRKPSRPR